MLQIVKDVLLPIHENVHLATGVIAATMSSLEADLVERIRKHPDMKGVGLFNVGPHVAGGKARTDEERKVEAWLNKRKSVSVIYIAFGTMYFGDQRPERAREIAPQSAGLSDRLFDRFQRINKRTYRRNFGMKLRVNWTVKATAKV
ncbi:hypothetical protein BV898_05687 [Hypsibius exemplaris]|uniref:Uncharacterized protein n=1 Tax=Hypsibius exemplaris TaxID=2072580 RepID=A0A1W0WYW7_HYPEX|nr:hypothetical protein BV898_05687 [Hypsibius exemplaris]